MRTLPKLGEKIVEQIVKGCVEAQPDWARKRPMKKDAKATAEFRATMSELFAKVVEEGPEKSVRIWVLDEHRYGLLPVIRLFWARKGVRVHAPYKATYQWGSLHEALEVDGQHKAELLLTPTINQDAHAVFLTQIAESDPQALHVVVKDQAGFYMQEKDQRIPSSLRVVSLPPYCPGHNRAEWFGRLVKAPKVNRIYQSLRHLEDRISAVARRWSDPANIATLIHERMRVDVNAIAKSKSLLAR